MWGEEGRKEDREAAVRSQNKIWNRRTGRWNREWTVEHKLKPWESKCEEGEGTKCRGVARNFWLGGAEVILSYWFAIQEKYKVWDIYIYTCLPALVLEKKHKI